ncbi:MAG: hypothetical protein IJ172_10385, partial [Ruminococcus sp.]|nr:hypothetical protein [Ruminococcus sp.]
GWNAIEKSSPRTPLRNLLMIFATWQQHCQGPKMTESFCESAVRNLFRRTNPTMNQIYRNKCGFTELTK